MLIAVKNHIPYTGANKAIDLNSQNVANMGTLSCGIITAPSGCTFGGGTTDVQELQISNLVPANGLYSRVLFIANETQVGAADKSHWAIGVDQLDTTNTTCFQIQTRDDTVDGNSYDATPFDLSRAGLLTLTDGLTTGSDIISGDRFIAPVGSAALPSYTFAGHLTDGIYLYHGTEGIGFSVLGVEKMKILAGGVTIADTLSVAGGKFSIDAEGFISQDSGVATDQTMFQDGTGILTLHRETDATSGSILRFESGDSGDGYLDDDETIGLLQYRPANEGDYTDTAAKIRVAADGNHSSDDFPTKIVWSTTSGLGLVDKMVLDKDGNLDIINGTIETAASVAWDLGAASSGAPTPDSKIRVSIGGVDYDISAQAA